MAIISSKVPEAVRSPRARLVLYWIATVIIAFESAMGGVWDVLRTDYVRDVLETQLDYPHYVAVVIGVCKIPGAAVLVMPGLPRLKEWVYAGAVFIYTGAVVSHLAVGDAAAAAGPFVFAAITFLSWALRPEPRRALTSWKSPRSVPLVFRVTTGIIVFVLLTGGVSDLIQRGGTAAGVTKLGYPSYFLYILGTWKILGTAALLAPRYPRLKEWAYAGAFYNFAGAFVSHIVSGSAAGHLVWTSLFAACTLLSWATRPHSRAAGDGRLRPRRRVPERGPGRVPERAPGRPAGSTEESRRSRGPAAPGRGRG